MRVARRLCHLGHCSSVALRGSARAERGAGGAGGPEQACWGMHNEGGDPRVGSGPSDEGLKDAQWDGSGWSRFGEPVESKLGHPARGTAPWGPSCIATRTDEAGGTGLKPGASRGWPGVGGDGERLQLRGCTRGAGGGAGTCGQHEELSRCSRVNQSPPRSQRGGLSPLPIAAAPLGAARQNGASQYPWPPHPCSGTVSVPQVAPRPVTASQIWCHLLRELECGWGLVGAPQLGARHRQPQTLPHSTKGMKQSPDTVPK